MKKGARAGKRIYKRKRATVAVRVPRAPRYNGDYLMKCQYTQPLIVDAGGANQAWVEARIDGTGSGPHIGYLVDIPEFQAMLASFNSYRVNGIKLTMSINQYQSTANNLIEGPRMWAGGFRNMPTVAPFSVERLNFLENQAQGGIGTAVSLYQPVAGEIERLGGFASVSTGEVYATAGMNNFGVIGIAETQGFAAGSAVGSYTITFYVLLSGRKSGY